MQIRYPDRSRRKGLVLVAFLIAAIVGFAPSPLLAGTISENFTSLGPNSFQYTFFFSGFDLLANQELDILFDPAVYMTLSNGVATSDFNLVLFQPNQPPGDFGDYSAFTSIDHPSLAGPFSVDVSFQAAVPQQAGSLPFTVDQFDGTGHFISTIDAGSTVVAAAPEPASVLLTALGTVLIGILCVIGRHSQRRKLARSMAAISGSEESPTA
jgi:hypothetical protein